MYSFNMSKLDEVKEILNTLRIAISVSFGLLVFTAGAVIRRYDNNNIDPVFWAGIVLMVLILVTILILIIKISSKTKEIREL